MWFMCFGKVKPMFLPHIHRRNPFIASTPCEVPFSSKLDVVKELCEMLCEMIDVGQSLSFGILQPIILGFINTHVPKVLGRFKVITKWVRFFVESQLKWNYWQVIMACGKLPNDWEDQEKFMMYRVGYLVKAYNIPPIFIMSKIK